jgi:hypothetical protein
MVLGERRWLWVGGVWLVVAGCYVKGDPYVAPDTSACSPLESVEAPIELGSVLGVGEAADGTVHLMDRVDLSLRVFVSSGNSLVRVLVSGEGTLYDAGVETNLASFERGGVDVTLGVEAGATTRIAVGPGTVRSFEEVLASGEELTIVPDTAIEDYVLRNLPGDVEIEYVAQIETGERLVVIRPSEEWTYDDFRLFIGEPERLVERQVTSVVRARDGGSTWIRFDFHGEAAEVSFPSPLAGPAADPATLTTGTGTYAVERLPPESVTSFSFECLENREPTNSPPPDAGA